MRDLESIRDEQERERKKGNWHSQYLLTSHLYKIQCLRKKNPFSCTIFITFRCPKVGKQHSSSESILCKNPRDTEENQDKYNTKRTSEYSKQ